ncbi:hypothetical protein L3X38_012211 [Prunus dulcis]|uniref:Tf2-1-like SH3-like domain-containing protein n=1 Tax=Prunus dulcis TaxID=3755 RepID=A0AAD4ZFV3_PRUDU|nr:hypothetical protein L3X38_012211 [Prunus dulcis]
MVSPRPARIVAQIKVVSPRPARVATRVDLVSSRPTRIVAQIKVVSLRPARVAARVDLMSPRPARMELTVEIFGKCSIYRGNFAEFSAGVALKFHGILVRRAICSIVFGNQQVSEFDSNSKVEFRSGPVNLASIGVSPFDALYGKQCRTPLFWDEVAEHRSEVSEDVERTKKQVELSRERLKAAHSRQKSYVDNRRKDLQFGVGDLVFLKLSPRKGIVRFGKRGKLSPRYIGPYEILERVGPVAYRLALPLDLSRFHDVVHVSVLQKYISDHSHVLEEQPIELKDDFTYMEQPVQILDLKTHVLRSREIPFVKVLWRSHNVEEATWEPEDQMRDQYPFLFE